MYHYLCATITLLALVGLSAGFVDPLLSPTKTQKVKISAAGPWQIDPTANFMGQYRFLNFVTAWLNNQTDILPGVEIDLVFSDTGTTPGIAVFASVDAVDDGVIGFIGGARTPQQQIVSYLANSFFLPHVGGIVTGAVLSDKTNYPFFMRTSLADQFVCQVMLQYILLQGWTNVVLITQTDDYGTGNRQAFLSLAQQHNMTIWTTQINTGQTDYGSQISQIYQTGIRILVFLVEINEANVLMKAIAADGRLKTPDYVYLIGQVYFNGWYGVTTLNGTIFDGALCFSSISITTPLSMRVWNAWVQSNTTTWPGSRTNINSISRTYWFLSDALLTFALGLQQYQSLYGPQIVDPATNKSTVNGTLLYKAMRALNYTGISGPVQFDSNGDRLALCNVYNVRQSDLNQTSSFYANVTASLQYSPFTGQFTTLSPIAFYGGSTNTPSDMACSCLNGHCNELHVCICNPGWSGSNCDIVTVAASSTSTTIIIISVVLPSTFAVLVLVVGLLYYRRRRALDVKEISDKQRSDIPRSAIKLGHRIGRGASGEVYSALFRGTEVAVKVLSAKNLSQSALQQFQLETAIMTGLRHPNIILFMGSCYDKSAQEFLLILELCTRGSLYDVLYNKNLSLQYELQLHLAYQIVQGINFLHQSSPPIIHCDIKSHNVLLDEKWNARICDFGITIFSSVKQKQNDEALGTVYWTAPEVLMGGTHTIQSDCYSVGILLWEIFHRQLPYGGRDPLQVAMEVVNLGNRPVISSHVPQSLARLIANCWDQDPGRRPSIQDIVYSLRDMAMEKPMYNFSSEETRMIIAPTGSVVFACTEIVGAYKLWDAAPKEMIVAMKQHNTIMRTLLDSYKGYEVSFKGHSIFVAFARVADALNWSLAVQLAFVRTTWPEQILSVATAKQESDGAGQYLWNGPRVKIALHKGVPQCVQDKITQQMKYEGPVVKRLLQLREKGLGGIIVVSRAVHDDFASAKIEHEISVEQHEGHNEPTFSVLPTVLAARRSTARPTSPDNLPYTVIDISTTEATPDVSFKSHRVSQEEWAISNDDVTLLSQIGVGTGAEVHSGTYKGIDVAVKVLINQNFTEENNLTLRYLAATLSKIDHPNILRCRGMVLDPPHISLVTELMSGSLYKFYMSTSQFPHAEKIRIAKAVAVGMQHLSSLDDRSLANNQRLNSNNILLGKAGEVKISDFAINKLYDSNRTLTSVNAVAWTPPEMLNGDEHLSAAVPVYAFGIIMWEMLMRKRPYMSIHPIRLLNMVAKGHRPEIPPECPPAWNKLMQECWADIPSDRPTWGAIIQRLGTM